MMTEELEKKFTQIPIGYQMTSTQYHNAESVDYILEFLFDRCLEDSCVYLSTGNASLAYQNFSSVEALLEVLEIFGYDIEKDKSKYGDWRREALEKIEMAKFSVSILEVPSTL